MKQKINRKFRVATEIGSTFFGCWLDTGQLKFPIERIPSCPILKFWDFGHIIAVGQNRLKIVIPDFFYHHYKISER
jgi:hypothetical protein